MQDTIYGLIHEPDPKRAPRFRLRVNGRWIDIQLAEALLMYEILDDYVRVAREAMALGVQAESEYVAVRDMVVNRRGGKIEIDFDGGRPTIGPGRVVH